MTYRCLELLDLPASEHAIVGDDDDDDDGDDEEEDRVRARPSYLLDIGAGSGLSGEILTEEGHQWVGMDVSGGMLGQSLRWPAPSRPDTDGPLLSLQRSHSSAKSKATSCSPISVRESHSDRVLSTAQSRQSILSRSSEGLGEREKTSSWSWPRLTSPSGRLTRLTFAPTQPCSVSVLQWLCNADSTSHSPVGRLLRFFTDLFGCLRKGSRAVFQFYPESDEQVKFIMNQATRAGFGGGLCVDYVSFTRADDASESDGLPSDKSSA